MKDEIKVKDLLIPLTEYPHLPYWATFKEALIQLSSASEPGMNTVLVFDEAYRLVGILTQADILRGIEPKFARHYEEGVPVFWSELLAQGAKKNMTLPIKELMSEAKTMIEASDNILKASHLMLLENQEILAVKENDRVIGVIRLDNVLHEIIDLIIDLD